MRRAFINTLMELAKVDESIYLLTGDAGFTILEPFREKYPDRYYNVGISEGAMIGLAAGLAMSGKKVFVYSIVPFVTMRCFEQVRIDLCYQKLPVKLIGVGQGFTYGTAGTTHHAIEDIAIMRALPGMTVICPAGPIETGKAVAASMDLEGPCYIRLGKSGEPSVHESADFDFIIGRGLELKKGRNLALIGTSNMVEPALRVADILEKNGTRPAVISMPTVKPIDADLIEKLSKKCEIIATVEEHNSIGGLGDAVGSVILERDLKIRLIKFAIPDSYAEAAGCQGYLRECFGLLPEQIAERLKKELKCKNR